jgi:uncharacterized membrane protein YeaQ/YmgE (transglycosylase-associated protein family)
MQGWLAQRFLQRPKNEDLPQIMRRKNRVDLMDTHYWSRCWCLAKFIMPGKGPGGIIVTALLGVAGSVVASFLGQRLGLYGEGVPAGFIGSTIGASARCWQSFENSLWA